MKKETAITALNSLPDEFELDEALETLVFVDSIEKGIAQADAGETIPHSEVEKLVESWKKLGGPKEQRSI